jgi:hypothetical protein
MPVDCGIGSRSRLTDEISARIRLQSVIVVAAVKQSNAVDCVTTTPWRASSVAASIITQTGTHCCYLLNVPKEMRIGRRCRAELNERKFTLICITAETEIRPTRGATPHLASATEYGTDGTTTNNAIDFKYSDVVKFYVPVTLTVTLRRPRFIGYVGETREVNWRNIRRVPSEFVDI